MVKFTPLLHNDLVCIKESLDRGIATLMKNDYQLASCREIADGRMIRGETETISLYNGITSEAFVHFPKQEEIFITKNPLTGLIAKKLVEAHKNHKEFYPSDDELGFAMENSFKVPYSTKFQEASLSFPTHRLTDDGLMNFLFGTSTKEYGNFLRNIGVKELIITPYLPKKENNPFVRPLVFKNIHANSGLESYKFADYRQSNIFGIKTNHDLWV